MTAPLSAEDWAYRPMNSSETTPPKRLRRLSASRRNKCCGKARLRRSTACGQYPRILEARTLDIRTSITAFDSAPVRTGSPDTCALAEGMSQPVADQRQDDEPKGTYSDQGMKKNM